MKRMSKSGIAYVAFNAAVLAFLVAPLAIVFVFAFDSSPFIHFPPTGFTLGWFEKFLTGSGFLKSFVLSLQVAAGTVALSAVLGTGAALALARGTIPGSAVLVSVLLSPLMLPAILSGFAMFQLLVSADFGRPVWALVLGHTVVAAPYVLRTTLAVLVDFDRRIEEAAAVFGASPTRVFFEVTLPLIRPGAVAGSVFAFITSFDQFPISLFLAAPGRETLPIVMFNYMKFELDGALAAASVVSIVLAVCVVYTLDRTVGLRATTKI
jgi:putative spermidine/putrescine transport system permease protein